jgi:hypothetical protein
MRVKYILKKHPTADPGNGGPCEEGKGSIIKRRIV